MDVTVGIETNRFLPERHCCSRVGTRKHHQVGVNHGTNLYMCPYKAMEGTFALVTKIWTHEIWFAQFTTDYWSYFGKAALFCNNENAM